MRRGPVENILNRKAFTVSVADEAHLAEADYVGLASGNDVPDKLARSGFHVTRSEFVDAPVFDELPLVLECRLLSYDSDSHFMLGEIVNAGAEVCRGAELQRQDDCGRPSSATGERPRRSRPSL